MSGAIQLREQSPLDTLVNEEWPRSIVELVKKQACPKGIPDGDFYVFMRKCQQTGLNPLTGEAFCVPRRTNIAPKGKEPEWVTLYQFQPSAEGMRTRAARFPDFAKIDGAAVFANDVVANVDPGTGVVEHRFNAAKPRGVLMGAWGRVVKKDGTTVVVWLPAGSRGGQPEGFWKSDPGGMLTKCAEVAALRRAYPVHFGGVYAREEMPDEHAEPSRAEQVLQRLDGQSQATESEKPALPPPSPGPVLEFGPLRGTPIKELSRGQVQEALSYGATQQADSAYAKLKPTLKAKVEASMSALQAALEAMPPEPEPTEELLPDATDDAQALAEPGAGG